MKVVTSKGDWSRVRFQETGDREKEGWILKRYLMDRKPLKVQAGLSDEHVEGFDYLSKLDKFYFGQVGEIGIIQLPLVLENGTIYVAADREVRENTQGSAE